MVGIALSVVAWAYLSWKDRTELNRVKITLSSVFLLVLAVAFFAASYLANRHSRLVEDKHQQELIVDNKNRGFSISEPPVYNWTYWDVGSIAFLVFASSSVVAAVRLAR
jgi:hypothetical protein